MSAGIYWFIYEMSKSFWLQRSGDDSLHFVEAFSSGALAGSTAAVITLPFDVIKTHRQIELGENFHLKKPVTSTWKLIAQLYRQKGFSALFAGMLLTYSVDQICGPVFVLLSIFGCHFLEPLLLCFTVP